MELTNVGMRHLRSFVVLAEALHFGRRGPAARVAASLSQTLKQLEDATDLRLFERTTRRVAMTAEGATIRLTSR